MVFVLVFISIVACVAVDYLLRRQRAPALKSEPAAVSSGAANLAPTRSLSDVGVPEVLYYHPGHTWVSVEGNSSVRIGMDDFARKIVGSVRDVKPPSVGRSVRQGLPIWSLHRDGERVAMLSPVDGVVEEINPAVLKDPELIRKDPYGEGWVARVRVAELGRNLRNLLHGSVVDRWMDDAVEKLYGRFQRDLGPVMADGGMLDEDFPDTLDEAEWAAICREHFLSEAVA